MKKMAILVLCLAIYCASGCGAYVEQATFRVGDYGTRVDAVTQGVIKPGQRSVQMGMFMSQPATQTVSGEKKTTKTKGVADERGCPDPAQRRKYVVGETVTTEVTERVIQAPASTVAVGYYGNADDGPGTKLIGKAMDAAATVGGAAVFGASLRPSNTNNVNANQADGGAGGAGYGGHANATGGAGGQGGGGGNVGPITVQQQQGQQQQQQQQQQQRLRNQNNVHVRGGNHHGHGNHGGDCN